MQRISEEESLGGSMAARKNRCEEKRSEEESLLARIAARKNCFEQRIVARNSVTERKQNCCGQESPRKTSGCQESEGESLHCEDVAITCRLSRCRRFSEAS